MEIHAVNIIYDICIMSALMLIAKIIRTKIKIIQKLYRNYTYRQHWLQDV